MPTSKPKDLFQLLDAIDVRCGINFGAERRPIFHAGAKKSTQPQVGLVRGYRRTAITRSARGALGEEMAYGGSRCPPGAPGATLSGFGVDEAGLGTLIRAAEARTR